MRTVLLREGDYFVVQGIEHDIAAQGKTPERAQEAFMRTVVGQAALDVSAGKQPLEGIPPAPGFYLGLAVIAESSVGLRVRTIN